VATGDVTAIPLRRFIKQEMEQSEGRVAALSGIDGTLMDKAASICCASVKMRNDLHAKQVPFLAFSSSYHG
jgi:hypothetical protein